MKISFFVGLFVSLSFFPLLSYSGTSEFTDQDFERAEEFFEQASEKTCDSFDVTTIIDPNLQKAFLEVISYFPCESLVSLQKVEIYSNANTSLPRAMASYKTLRLREDIIDDENLNKILVHELAHVIDLGFLTGAQYTGKSEFDDHGYPIWNNDKSLDFYRYSWKNSMTQEGLNLDFVSGYASSDPFEDFAESVAYYIFHGKEFEIFASQNQVLQKKYAFLKENVFDGKTFETGDINIDTQVRVFDVTKL